MQCKLGSKSTRGDWVVFFRILNTNLFWCGDVRRRHRVREKEGGSFLGEDFLLHFLRTASKTYIIFGIKRDCMNILSERL